MITAALILATVIIWFAALVSAAFTATKDGKEFGCVVAVVLLLSLAGAFTFAAIFQVPQ